MTEGRRIDRFLRLLKQQGGSDLHLSVGCPPMIRRSGKLEPIKYRTLSKIDWENLIQPIATADVWQGFLADNDLDFAYELPEVARFRVNLFMQERGPTAVLRIIPTKIMTIEELGMPPAVKRLGDRKRGLILVTGPTGSGKSTTLAGLVNQINAERALHIITIEDPIEFVHENKQSLLHQREVGPHAQSFAEAMKSAIREDPDLILLGEMRDVETIRLALAAAEKGLLVFGTLHTNNAAKTVDRMVSVFPVDEHEMVRAVVGEVLQGIVAQQLCRKVGGGRVAAVEVLLGSRALATMIRDQKISQITSYIQTGRREGMISMDESLMNLLNEGLVTPLVAFEKAIDKESFKDLVQKSEKDAASLVA